MDLTDRQIQIVKCMVEEYSETADAVGSETLDKKYNLGISPATIRNEMVELTRKGFLAQLHTSAGRIPTPAAIKFYVAELLKEKDLSVAEEVSVKERVWDVRDELDLLLKEATRVLSERTGMLSIAMTNDHRLYHAGYARILDLPEFFNIDITRQVLYLLEEDNRLYAMFDQAHTDDPIHILLGEELGAEMFRPLGLVFADFKIGRHSGRLGVLGPCRLNYAQVIPMVRYVNQIVSEVGKG